MNISQRLASLLVLLALAPSLPASPATQRLYLSGRDKDNTVPWAIATLIPRLGLRVEDRVLAVPSYVPDALGYSATEDVT